VGNLSAHFDRSEFACLCGCAFDTVDTQLLEVLEGVRQHFGAPVTILSGCRCPKHNYDVGGSEKSQHKKGRAADFVVNEHLPIEVQNYLKITYPDSLGIGSYTGFTHVDARTRGGARWNG